MKSNRFMGKIGVVTACVAAAVALAATPANATPEMKFYDDYWTLEECTTVGNWGLDYGKWTVYDCQFSGWDYDLYYDS
jgi:hypothetical protein